MRQERAEIQNIVVVRHWSLVDLRRLYQLAEEEAAHPTENPPPSFQGVPELESGDPRLPITSSEHDEKLSDANGKTGELSLSQLDASMKKAVHRPKILHSPGENVVDVLLDEWTRLRDFDPRYRHKRHKYKSSYHTDDEEDSLPEFERSKKIGGQYIEGPANGQRKVKNVRFRARVESDPEDSDKGKESKRPPSRHVMRSEASASSSSSLTSSSSDYSDLTPPPTPIPRLYRESSAPERGSKDYSSSSRRYTPSALSTSLADNQTERPGSRAPPSPKQSRPTQIQNPIWQGHAESQAEGPGTRQPPSPIQARPMPMPIQNQSWQGYGDNQHEGPLSRGPPSPMQARPSPIQNQSWQGQFTNPNLGIRPPHQHPNIPLSPHRTASVGSPGMPYGSPIPPAGRPFHPPPQPVRYPMPREKSQRSKHRPPREKRQESSRGIGSREKNILKKSLISAGAVAGLLDILDGLGAI